MAVLNFYMPIGDMSVIMATAIEPRDGILSLWPNYRERVRNVKRAYIGSSWSHKLHSGNA